MDISDWRKKVDELDRKLAALLNERATAAIEIGRLKRNTKLPIYEPADLRTHHGRDAQHPEARNRSRDWASIPRHGNRFATERLEGC